MKNALPKKFYSGKQGSCHCQGLSVDLKNGYAYFSFTTKLIKTDLSGNVIGSVENITGHLGCIDFCENDGRVYASLEYKNDEIGKGILKKLGISDDNAEDAFYIAVFDADKIDREHIDAEKEDIMRVVYLPDVVKDFNSTEEVGGKTYPHAYGCSGIDGLAIGPDFGAEKNSSPRLNVCYGVYGDANREGNDHQVILSFDFASFWKNGAPINKFNMPKNAARPTSRYYLYTGNTTYGVQNLEYDAFSDCYLAFVYEGKKTSFPNHSMFAIDQTKSATHGELIGRDGEKGLLLSLKDIGNAQNGISGLKFDRVFGSMGVYSIGNGDFYFALTENSVTGENEATVALYRLDNTSVPWKFLSSSCRSL